MRFADIPARVHDHCNNCQRTVINLKPTISIQRLCNCAYGISSAFRSLTFQGHVTSSVTWPFDST